MRGGRELDLVYDIWGGGWMLIYWFACVRGVGWGRGWGREGGVGGGVGVV